METREGQGGGTIEPPPRLILFDLDDTLCDYAGARNLRLRRAFAPAIGQAAVTPAIEIEQMIADSLAIHPHGADHFAALFQRYGINDPALAEAASTWYRTNRFFGLKLFGDAVPLLTKLREARPARTIGVITNGPADVQRAKVELLAVERLVDFVIISDEFGCAKPEPAIFAEALRLGGATARETVLIGDSIEHDIAGARAAGITPIWLNRQGQDWPGPGIPPAYRVHDLAEVEAILLGQDERGDDIQPNQPESI